MTGVNEKKRALVLGATGGIGGAVAAKLLERGWQVTALTRDVQSASARWQASPRRSAAGNPLWLAGDAMVAEDVARAAEGARLIVHAVNPPGYRDWDKLVLPMLENSVAAAAQEGARILLPGTVYNYGPDTFSLIGEAAPQHPLTRKGAIRVRMEARLREAARQGGKSLIVRAGDFFGPDAGSSWFSQGLIKAGKPLTAITYPGRPGVGHQWAYLPDVAETMVRLVEREESLAPFELFHMGENWDEDGTRMIAAIRAASEQPGLKVHSLPWPLLKLAAPFVTVLHEMQEMRYLWQQPVQLDNRRLVGLLGAEPHTPLVGAVRQTLSAFGCLRTENSNAA